MLRPRVGQAVSRQRAGGIHDFHGPNDNYMGLDENGEFIDCGVTRRS